MRILIITSSLPPSGGAENVAWETAVKLSRDNEVSVLTFGHSNDRIMLDNVSVHILKLRSHLLWYYMTFGRGQITKVVNLVKPDVIHSHMHSIITFVLRFQKGRKILTLHNSEFEKYNTTIIQKLKHEYFTRKSIKHYDKVTTVSKHMKSYLEDTLNKSIDFVPNGINGETFYISESIRRSAKTIIYVGRLVEFKGILPLLKAAEELRDYRFIIVGSGPLMEVIKAPNIEYVGLLDGDQIREYLNESQFAVFPSKYENFPLVGLEAMACGAIVLANDIKGFREYVEPESNGFLANLEEASDIVSCVRSIAQRRDLDSIREKGIYTAATFSLNNSTLRYLQIYEQAKTVFL